LKHTDTRIDKRSGATGYSLSSKSVTCSFASAAVRPELTLSSLKVLMPNILQTLGRSLSGTNAAILGKRR